MYKSLGYIINKGKAEIYAGFLKFLEPHIKFCSD